MTAALGLNYRGILGSCLPLQLLGAEDVSQMQADVVGRGLEKVSHLPLGQPDGIPIEANIDARLATLDLVDDDLAAGGCCRRYGAHGIGWLRGGRLYDTSAPGRGKYIALRRPGDSSFRMGWNPCRFCTGCPGLSLEALQAA